MKDEYILASDDWSDIDVSCNSILIVYYDYRPEVLEIEEHNEYGWKKRGEPKKYIAAHTWTKELSHRNRKTSTYIGSLTEHHLRDAYQEECLYRKVIDRGSTGYIGRRETQETQKVNAIKNPKYYNKNHGGMKGMRREDEIVNLEKVREMAKTLKVRASEKNKASWLSMSKEDLKNTVKPGQIRKYKHKNKADLKNVLEDVYKGDTFKFWNAIILTPVQDINEPLIKWSNINGNNRRDITLSSGLTSIIPYVIMTEEERRSLNNKELESVQQILNEEVQDLSDPGNAEETISWVYGLIKSSGKTVSLECDKTSWLDKDDPIIKALKDKGFHPNKIWHNILREVKQRIKDETSTWIPDGYQHKDYKDKDFDQIKEDSTIEVKQSDGTVLTSKVFVSSCAKFNYDQIGVDLSKLRNKKCNYNRIIQFIHFPDEKGHNHWKNHLEEQVRDYLHVQSITYSHLTGRSIKIEIKDLEYLEIKTDNDIVSQSNNILTFHDAAD
jgi:hypothetical protein